MFILSGKDALDYFKEDPALFDVVSFVFFHSINEFTLYLVENNEISLMFTKN